MSTALTAKGADARQHDIEAPGGASNVLRKAWGHKWFVRLVIWGLLLLCWQIAAMAKGPTWLPTVPALAGGMVDVFRFGYQLTLFESLQQMFFGFLITTVAAIPLGVLMGRSRFAADFFSPWVNTLFSSPKEALLPLLIILFGTGLEYRVSVVVLFSMFFVVMNTAAGVRHADKQLIETANAFLTPPLRVVTRVIIPAAAPFIVAGMRMGLGMALKAMIVAELWVSYGTGGLIEQIGEQRLLPLYFALSLLVILVAAVITQSLQWLEQWLRKNKGMGV